MIILAIDPSGDFEAGKGKTGFAFVNTQNFEKSLRVMSLKASKFPNKYDYWKQIIGIVEYAHNAAATLDENFHVVIESFVVRNNGFTTGTMPETIRLIGALEFMLLERGIPYTFQTPSSVKTRFNNDVLLKYIPSLIQEGNYFKLKGHVINDHERDALRHLMFYKKYKKE